jgi:LPS-assembly lipoprotein
MAPSSRVRARTALTGAAFGVMTLLLAACGFTPMYATGGSPAITRIAVTAEDNRLGYRLREQLEDALAWDRGSQPLYRLTTVTHQARRPLGRRIDDTATRYELTVRVAWTLTPASGGAPLTGTEASTSTYAAADQP